MSYTSFTDFIPGHDSMGSVGTSRKRPAASYNDFDVVKSRRTMNEKEPDTFFVSDDEGDTLLDDDLFGNDSNDDFLAAANATRPEAQSNREAPAYQAHTAFNHSGRPVSLNNQNGGHGPTFAAAKTASTSLNTPTVSPSLPSISAMQETISNKPAVEVKDEPDDGPFGEPEWLRTASVTDSVRLYVGKRNRQVYVKRSDLAKSPILTSYIIEPNTDLDPSQSTAYIMRPQLLRTDFKDFDAVLQFLHSGEYAPLLVDMEENGERAMILDGIKDDEAYSRELVRAGRIYVIAQTFRVEGLEDIVYRKITEVDVRKYSIKSLVELAGVVFSDKRSASSNSNMNGPSSSQNNSSGVAYNARDKLEEWIIGQIAKNFQEIMKAHHEAFWVVERKTSKKMFLALVLEETAERYRSTGGKMLGCVVELD